MKLLWLENHAVFADLATRKFLAGHEVAVVPTMSGARAAIERAGEPFEAVLVDFDLDDGKGDEFVHWLRRRGFEGAIVAVSALLPGNEALQAAGADACCPKGDFDRIEEVLRAARSPEGRRLRATALLAPAPLRAGDVDSLAIHVRDPSGRLGRVLLVRAAHGLTRRVDRAEAADPFEERPVADLIEVLAGAVLDRPDVQDLGLDLELAALTRDSQAKRWANREELEERVRRYYASAPAEPSGHVRVAIEFSGDRRIVLDSESDRAYLLPWTIARKGEPPRKSYDARIGRALGRFVPPGFPGADRLSGANLLEDLRREGGADEPVLVPPGPPPRAALMVAAREGRLDEVKSLLAAGAAVGEADERGWTALVHAVHGESMKAEMNLLKVVRALLDGGADLAARDEAGRTALDHALEVEAERRFALEVETALARPGTAVPSSIGPHRTSLRQLLSKPPGSG